VADAIAANAAAFAAESVAPNAVPLAAKALKAAYDIGAAGAPTRASVTTVILGCR